jgi:hypothetical protein
MQTPNDAQLHELARKRVEFRIHLTVYCVTNAALWMICSSPARDTSGRYGQ